MLFSLSVSWHVREVEPVAEIGLQDPQDPSLPPVLFSHVLAGQGSCGLSQLMFRSRQVPFFLFSPDPLGGDGPHAFVSPPWLPMQQ